MEHTSILLSDNNKVMGTNKNAQSQKDAARLEYFDHHYSLCYRFTACKLQSETRNNVCHAGKVGNVMLA